MLAQIALQLYKQYPHPSAFVPETLGMFLACGSVIVTLTIVAIMSHEDA